jgi:hypothetical protein
MKLKLLPKYDPFISTHRFFITVGKESRKLSLRFTLTIFLQEKYIYPPGGNKLYTLFY